MKSYDPSVSMKNYLTKNLNLFHNETNLSYQKQKNLQNKILFLLLRKLLTFIFKKMTKKSLAFSLIELSIVILIIGILVAGVTQGSRLVRESRLTNARTITQSSDIISIKDMTLWLDATDENTIKASTLADADSTDFGNVENNDAISVWIDKNPQLTRKIQVTSNSDAQRPAYIENAINGLPSLYFTDDYMFSGDLVPLTAGDDDYTLIGVFQFDAIDADNDMIFAQTPDGFPDNDAGFLKGESTNFGWWGGNNDYTPATVAALTPYIAIAKVNHNNSNNVSIYLNSNSPSTGQSQAGGSAANVSDDRFGIGAMSDGGPGFFNGYISEIIYYDRALKQAEIESINAYLSKKYGIPVS